MTCTPMSWGSYGKVSLDIADSQPERDLLYCHIPVFDEVAQDEIGNTDKCGNGGNISNYL